MNNLTLIQLYSSPYQPRFCNWAFAYPRDLDRFNPCTPLPPLFHQSKPKPTNPVPHHPEVDIMLTHGPPLGILDAVAPGQKVGCDHLLRAVQRAQPLLHCFGHIHEGWGALRMDWASSTCVGIPVDKKEVRERRCAYVNGGGSSSTAKAGRQDTAGQGALEKGRETLFVNASIMDASYRPVNAPWLVDLDLPVRSS